MYDLVIRGGRVLDPASGHEGAFEIGISSGRISALALNGLEGMRIIDAGGLVVAPGFVDPHSHVDGSIRGGEWMALQGVTTVIGGNCGDLGDGRQDVGALLARFDEEGFSINHGLLVGATDLRVRAGAVDRYAPAMADQVAEIAAEAEKAMVAGALGISLGLAYAPGTCAEELSALFRAAGRHSGLIAVHPRYAALGMPGGAPDAVAGQEELIRLASETQTRLHISHIGSQIAWKSRPYDDLLRRGLQSIEDARKHGVDVSGDCHPYDAWCTNVGAAAVDMLLVPLFTHRYGLDLSAVEVASGPHLGKHLDPQLLAELRKCAPETPIVGHTMREDLVARALAAPDIMVGSDAVFEGPEAVPIHPRSAGTFPRVLRRMVRELGVLSLNEALYKMSFQPAQRFGLHNKGRLAVGCDADLVLFDPVTVEDTATYENTATGPRGIPYVIVNGVPVVDKGRIQPVRPGRAVRRFAGHNSSAETWMFRRE